MSLEAVAYVQGLSIPDETARRVFLLLAERTRTTSSRFSSGTPEVMGLELTQADLPGLAVEAGLSAEHLSQQLRGLKQHVRMDVLEHAYGVWEIVYGPIYTGHAPQTSRPPISTAGGVSAREAFWMPGWDRYSTWGFDEGMGCFYAQLYHNSDDRDAQPRIWITPPRHVIMTVDNLVQVIADALGPYEQAPPLAALVKAWMTEPPDAY